MTTRYPWLANLPDRPRRGGPVAPPIHRRKATTACANCGYDPLGRRRKCPACHRPVEEAAG